ncbi:MAG: hypothetical protein NWF05_06795 [Candidatus Bathyarchaeota archaeon]|nr:hypothetical protein [Candidatus Bathyarchaeota archaeon]
MKTADSSKTVGEVVCAYNVFEDQHPKGKYSWVIEKIEGEDESWQIVGKYEELGELANVALVYRAGDTVVLGEVKDDYVPNFLDPLLAKYGFDRVKWIVSNPKR